MQKQTYLPLIRLKMVKELDLPYSGEQLKSPEQVAKFASQVLEEADKEHILVISVSTKCQPLALEIVSIGSLDAAIAVPREVFKHAVMSNAAGILLVHNHPSGDCEPSEEDFRMTKRMQKAGELLGIHVYDHVVVGADGCYCSLMEQGKV